MRKHAACELILLTIAMLACLPLAAQAPGAFEQVTGKAFEAAIPNDFYLEGNRIPVDKHNAVLLKTPAGTRLILAIIDTTGYSSQIKVKYTGMVISEGKIMIGGVPLRVGSYGFGLDKPAASTNGDAKFSLYNQAGQKIGGGIAKKDMAMKQPTPLSVVLSKEEGARLYLGRYFVELK